MTTATLQVGTRLRNGALVLQSAPYPGHPSGVLVLCLSRDEFVTWAVNPTDLEAYWGHYFGSDLGSALADFTARTEGA